MYKVSVIYVFTYPDTLLNKSSIFSCFFFIHVGVFVVATMFITMDLSVNDNHYTRVKDHLNL